VSECRVCLGPHDREIHIATVHLHQRWKERLLAALKPVPVAVPKTRKASKQIEFPERRYHRNSQGIGESLK